MTTARVLFGVMVAFIVAGILYAIVLGALAQ